MWNDVRVKSEDAEISIKLDFEERRLKNEEKQQEMYRERDVLQY